MKARKKQQNNQTQDTSWGVVADWYDDYLGQDDTYQSKVIWPNLERFVDDISRAKKITDQKRNTLSICDMACGQGFFSFKLAEKGYLVQGLDISPELIKHASDQLKGKSSNLSFSVAPSHNMSMVSSGTKDIVICVLALQNIQNMDGTFSEVARILKSGGIFIFVLNHPSFRVPQSSDWLFDPEKKIQSRVVSKYLQEATIKIDMNPGLTAHRKHDKYTVSFHRPLQTFTKVLRKHGFVVTRLEEWASHKKTNTGPRQEAENLARKEIPLFMCIEAQKQ